MFEGQEDKNFSVGINPNKQPKKIVSERSEKNVIVLVAILSLLVILLIAGLFWWILKRPQKTVSVKTPTELTSTSSLPKNNLPQIDDIAKATSTATSTDSIVNLSYGSLYKNEFAPIQPKADEIELPINVKNQTTNYYEVARKIPLDTGLNSLNENGYAFIASPKKEVNDFYTAYQHLIAAGVPQLLTTDFLYYDFQNHLKETYSDIKTQVFYKDIRNVNRKLFDIANTRYLISRKNVSNKNDQLVEAERLEAAYYAVALTLLKPRPEQIDNRGSLDKNLFSAKEAKDFDFIVPDYLKVDVDKEVALILGAKKVAKSPVLLYMKDYLDFRVVNEPNFHLVNFTLVTKWNNSVFPLYEKTEDCTDCKLDENDWLINFITSNLIAADFNSDSELKNIWARIYKVSSYFEGLRKDLSYLNYVSAIEEKLGDNYNLEEAYAPAKTVEEKIALAHEIRDIIAGKNNFDTLQGGYDREAELTMPLLGMRMLQESYWPDSYIFSRFVKPALGKYNGPAKLPAQKKEYNLFTACTTNMKDFLRCRPTANDLVNVIFPLSDNEIFSANIQYDGYDSAVSSLASTLDNFNKDNWHENIYWTAVNVAKNSLYKSSDIVTPINQSIPAWRTKDDNTMLGAWVNLKTGLDNLELTKANEKGMNDTSIINIYIEPNQLVIADLLANARMINSMLEKLQITEDAQYSNKKLAELIDGLVKIQTLQAKQLAGEKLTDFEQVDLADIVSRFKVTNKQKKSLSYKFGPMSMIERIDGIKFIATVYSAPQGKMMVVGPVFNYSETSQ